MKIDTSDGSVSFSAGSIRRAESRTHFLESSLGQGAEERVTNVEQQWRHITVRPEAGVAATLVFKNDCLHQIYLLMAIPSDDSNEWTATLELDRKSKHDKWLSAELGLPPYEYAWGRVDSEFDEKGCVSEIIVTYAR
jgi:hypothetical protein